MLKTISLKIIILVTALFLLTSVSISLDDNSCSCFSQTSLTILDDNCKNFCQEYLGLGTCVGWVQLDSNCVSGSMCIIDWEVYCLNGNRRKYSTWDYCPACPCTIPHTQNNPIPKSKKRIQPDL
jgi:hypothetical protein